MIYIYKEPSGWAEAMKSECISQGVAWRFFERHSEVPNESSVFMRLDQTKERREKSMATHQRLLAKQCRIIPNKRDGSFYDHKLFGPIPKPQYPSPKTLRFFADPALSAHEAIVELGLPIVSKSNFGSGSRAVRIHHTFESLLDEMNQIFSSEGLKTKVDERVQKGYAISQQFVGDGSHDIRVISVSGVHFFMVRRTVGDDFRASGSQERDCQPDPNTLGLEGGPLPAPYEHDLLSSYCDTLSAIDLIVDHSRKKIFCLEQSCAWTTDVYPDCIGYTWRAGKWHPTDYTGKDMFKLALGALLA